ncbi:MAG: HDOD domain-containing protein [Myxococcales bacterium FL481]|nr:MAG: HDOD domain-containing protein [Myxococcales bacterium FL481]
MAIRRGRHGQALGRPRHTTASERGSRATRMGSVRAAVSGVGVGGSHDASAAATTAAGVRRPGVEPEELGPAAVVVSRSVADRTAAAMTQTHHGCPARPGRSRVVTDDSAGSVALRDFVTAARQAAPCRVSAGVASRVRATDGHEPGRLHYVERVMAEPRSARPPTFRLPCPPPVLAEIVRAAGNPETSIVRLGKLTSHDPAFAAELLRVTNSPLYRRGAAVTSVMRAVAVLGARGLRNMALCAAARNCVDPDQLGKFDLGRYWEDSLRRGVASQLLSEKLGIGEPTEAFTTGLLQDLGVLGLILTRPEEAAQWMAAVGDTPASRRQAESELFGMTHDQLGARLAEQWGLPLELAEPLCFHHEPRRADPEVNGLCQIAGWAEIVAGVFSTSDRAGALDYARETLVAETKLTLAEVEELITAVSGRVEEAAATFQLSIREQPTVDEIVAEAERGLTRVNASYEELVQQLDAALAELEDCRHERNVLGRRLEARERELAQLQLSDTLTGLPNRRACWQRVADELGRISRNGESMGFLLVDVDQLKRCNDGMGHGFGDAVLQAVSVAMTSAVRQTDVVARVGGDEFVVMLPATDRAGAQVVADKLLAAVRQRRITTPQRREARVTVSVGLVTVAGPCRASWDPDAILTRVYRTADKALLAARQSGRDRVALAENDVPWGESIVA